MNPLRLAAALCMLIGDGSGHWNSKINLAGGRMLKEEGSGDSINAAWQCDPPESSTESPPVRVLDADQKHNPVSCSIVRRRSVRIVFSGTHL